MKQTLLLMLCTLMLIAAACAIPDQPANTSDGVNTPNAILEKKSDTATQADMDAEAPSTQVEIPDPFISCATHEEAAEIAGFEMAAPEEIAGSSISAIRIIEGELYEVIYADKNGEEAYRLRKAPGSDDISGDYREYPESSVLTAGETIVSCRGEGSLVYAANWPAGEYTFSLTAEKGMDAEAVADIIEGVN